MQVHTHTHTHLHVRTHACMHTHTHTHTHACTHTRMYAHTHTHTHTHTHAHTHTEHTVSMQVKDASGNETSFIRKHPSDSKQQQHLDVGEVGGVFGGDVGLDDISSYRMAAVLADNDRELLR